MNYTVTHTTKYTYSDAVPVCHNVVHLEPRPLPSQKYHDFRMLVHPEPFDIRSGKDSFGNNETYFSIEQAHLGLTVTAVSRIEVVPTDRQYESPAWEEIVEQLKTPKQEELLEASVFAFPTSHTSVLPEIREYAEVSFTPGRPVFEASQELTSRIHEDFQYDPRATNVSTPIMDVFASRRGVCQDFAHLQLACFRSLGLAAKYVSGYLRTFPPPGHAPLRGADASHAWVSVYCGDAGWVDFDPTNNMIPAMDHITIAWGRDYADVCPIRGVILGGGTHNMRVSVDVAAEDPELDEI